MSATITAVPPRAEVPVEETWALETVFATDDEWEEAFAGSRERLHAVESFRGRIADGPASLLAALQAADDLTEAISKVLVFALLRRSEDATNAGAGEMADRAIGLASRAESAGSFLGPEITALSDETITDWITQEPGLERYGHALTRITRLRSHIRSVEVEEILARAGEMAAASEITQSVLEDGELPLGEITDESGQTVRLAQGNLNRFVDSANRRVRQEAWEQSADAYLAFRNTFAATLAPLGAEYVAEVRRGMAERWTDRSANLGKGGGAFSSGTFGTEPFISITWQDTLSSVSTLAHELGHSMHSLLTWQNQPVTYARYGMSAAETASNLNQALMGAHLLAERDDRDWTIAVI